MEEKYNRMVTIDDIARIAGVGRGTVDRVIHNRGRVSKDTYDKVVKVIKELDYKPNIAARMLGKRKDLKIAVIYHNYESDFWNQVESGIAKAESEYAPMGIRIDRFVLEKINQKKQEEVLRSVIKDKYDGVAIVPYKSSEVVKLINELVEKNVPVIAFNNDEPCNRTAYVGQDLYKSGRTAGKLMAMMAKQLAFRGLAFIVTNGRYITITDPMIRFIGFKSVLGLPSMFWIMLTVYIAIGFIMKFTQYGRNIYSVGGNRVASRLSGISVKKVTILSFVISGLTAGIASILYIAQGSVALNNAGTGNEMDIMTAAILGGLSLAGGKGTVLNTFMGVVLLSVIANGMGLLSISSYYQMLIKGLILIVAVFIDHLREAKN